MHKELTGEQFHTLLWHMLRPKHRPDVVPPSKVVEELVQSGHMNRVQVARISPHGRCAATAELRRRLLADHITPEV